MDPHNPMTILLDWSKRDSAEHFRPHMETAMLFSRKERSRKYAIRRAMANGIEGGLYAEMGVAGGQGCRTFGTILGKAGLHMTGFDSFEGLEEDWTGITTGREKGAFTQNGVLPQVPGNVTLLKGWVQDTLPGYLAQNAGAPFAFVHMDMDTYTPTAYALGVLKSRLRAGSVILFDELYGYPGWRHHEYKALQEHLAPQDYKYISFAPESVAIELLRRPN